MEFTKETLLKKKQEYLNAAERSKLDSIANAGAADAIENLIKEIEAAETVKSPPSSVERE